MNLSISRVFIVFLRIHSRLIVITIWGVRNTWTTNESVSSDPGADHGYKLRLNLSKTWVFFKKTWLIMLQLASIWQYQKADLLNVTLISCEAQVSRPKKKYESRKSLVHSVAPIHNPTVFWHVNKIQITVIRYKIQDTRPGRSHFLGFSEVLISFSVTLSHSAPRCWTSCRGVCPTNQGLCIFSRSCTRYLLVTGRPAIAGNRTPVCCVRGKNVTITPPSRIMIRLENKNWNFFGLLPAKRQATVVWNLNNLMIKHQ